MVNVKFVVGRNGDVVFDSILLVAINLHDAAVTHFHKVFYGVSRAITRAHPLGVQRDRNSKNEGEC